jgi:hypothetical protein
MQMTVEHGNSPEENNKERYVSMPIHQQYRIQISQIFSFFGRVVWKLLNARLKRCCMVDPASSHRWIFPAATIIASYWATLASDLSVSSFPNTHEVDFWEGLNSGIPPSFGSSVY